MASPVTPDLLKRFAFEAESLGNYELAERYYKEVRESGLITDRLFVAKLNLAS